IGRMRREQYIWHAPEGVVGRQRLYVENIQCGATNSAGCESIDQCTLIDDRSSADIYEHSRRFHCGDLRLADKSASAGRQRRRNQHIVACGQKLSELTRTVIHVDQRIALRQVHSTAKRGNPHSESASTRSGGASDSAVPNDTKRAPCECRADKRLPDAFFL